MPLQAPYLFPPGARLGSESVVLRARAKCHKVDDYAGPLSIKTVLKGEVSWLVQGREHRVDRSTFLILADGEPYSMNIAAPKPVETCCVFFAPGFVESVALDSVSPLAQSLEGHPRAAPVLAYLTAVHGARERGIVTQMQSLAERCSTSLAPSAFEEDFLRIAIELLQLYQQIRAEAARVPAARESTRQELYRRLLTGREYMHSHGAAALSLGDVARAAGVSPFHFHRGFLQAFQKTPHQYLTAIRLHRARLLLESGRTVLEAALEVGFSSPSTFSRLFRSRFGEPPSTVRRRGAHNLARSERHASPVPGTLET